VLERIAADAFTFAAPGGESQQELEARMCSFVHRQLLPSLQWGGPPAVVVTHGLAIKWWVVMPAFLLHDELPKLATGSIFSSQLQLSQALQAAHMTFGVTRRSIVLLSNVKFTLLIR
jgi:broad specificity phosphatase PhoE